MESALKIMRVAVENSSFEYNLNSEIWISEGRGFLAEDASISEACPLEENASHHISIWTYVCIFAYVYIEVNRNKSETWGTWVF